MRFRTQLTLGVVALIAVTSMIGVFAVVTLHITNRRTVAVTRDVIEEVRAVQRVRVLAEQVVSRARAYLLTGTLDERVRLDTSERDLGDAIDVLEQQQDDPVSAMRLFVLEQRFLDYSHATAVAARARTQSDHINDLVYMFESVLQPRRDALDAAVDDLGDSERLKVEMEAVRTEHSLRTFSLALLAAFAAGIATSIALAVTVVRRLSEQYRRVHEAEVAADRAARARAEIVDIVAHDLLSPLHAIGLGLELIELRHGDVTQLATIRDAADRMNRLIKDLHDVSRAEKMTLSLERREWSIADLLAVSLVPFEQRAKRAGIELRRDVPTGLVATLDGERVQQVLANLVGNALRIAPRGTPVTVSATLHPGVVRFAVADHGPGISSTELASLFGAYKQGEAGRGSMGLGLYICKTLVTAHGGQIGADSEVGGGTTFWFDIPQPTA